jgi:hypothetical protein
MTKIQILICSKDRIESLSYLLQTLSKNYSKHPSIDVSILLVDASIVPYDLKSLQLIVHPLILTAVRCKMNGVAAARNSALINKEPSKDFYVFIDDDEFPSVGWLDALVLRAKSGNFVAVGGPVHPSFPKYHSKTYLNPFYLHQVKLSNGKITSLATGNLLLSNRLFHSTNFLPYFDERLNFSGGEDTEFTQRMIKVFGDSALGWSEEALVFESIPNERLRILWLLNRAFNLGKSTVALKKILGESRVLRLLSSLLNFSRSVLGFWKHILKGKWKYAIVYMLYMQAVAIGLLAGLLGFKSYQYRSNSSDG